MARAVWVEFPGAFYHVMARGDRREGIVRDDADRATFVRTLAEAEASERSGFRIHAFALMSNHYHLLLETPQANLSRGPLSRVDPPGEGILRCGSFSGIEGGGLEPHSGVPSPW
ncbi:MAG: transposase [Terrimicrobiaceae bacterium]